MQLIIRLSISAMLASMMVHGRVQTKAFFISGRTHVMFVCEEYTSFTHLDNELKLEMLKNTV
jgi:hypothetical protein